jgi:hypothetical protein
MGLPTLNDAFSIPQPLGVATAFWTARTSTTKPEICLPDHLKISKLSVIGHVRRIDDVLRDSRARVHNLAFTIRGTILPHSETYSSGRKARLA